jgi:hypothetical protein
MPTPTMPKPRHAVNEDTLDEFEHATSSFETFVNSIHYQNVYATIADMAGIPGFSVDELIDYKNHLLEMCISDFNYNLDQLLLMFDEFMGCMYSRDLRPKLADSLVTTGPTLIITRWPAHVPQNVMFAIEHDALVPDTPPRCNRAMLELVGGSAIANGLDLPGKWDDLRRAPISEEDAQDLKELKATILSMLHELNSKSILYKNMKNDPCIDDFIALIETQTRSEELIIPLVAWVTALVKKNCMSSLLVLTFVRNFASYNHRKLLRSIVESSLRFFSPGAQQTVVDAVLEMDVAKMIAAYDALEPAIDVTRADFWKKGIGKIFVMAYPGIASELEAAVVVAKFKWFFLCVTRLSTIAFDVTKVNETKNGMVQKLWEFVVALLGVINESEISDSNLLFDVILTPAKYQKIEEYAEQYGVLAIDPPTMADLGLDVMTIEDLSSEQQEMIARAVETRYLNSDDSNNHILASPTLK